MIKIQFCVNFFVHKLRSKFMKLPDSSDPKSVDNEIKSNYILYN